MTQKKMRVEIPSEVVAAIRECAELSEFVTVRELRGMVENAMTGALDVDLVVQMARQIHAEAAEKIQANPFEKTA